MSTISADEFHKNRDKYQALTNSQVLGLREQDPSLAYRSDILKDAAGAIGMKTISDQLRAYRAITMFKDEYLLDFINTEELFVRDKDRDERVIEQSIVQNVKEFIMTFGKDFTFVGNQYHL